MVQLLPFIQFWIFRYKMNSSMDSSMTMSDRLLLEPTFDMDDDELVEAGQVVQQAEVEVVEQEVVDRSRRVARNSETESHQVLLYILVCILIPH